MGTSPTTLRVLFVDDNADIAELSQELLTEWGHDVVTAGDGPEAIARAAAHDPDIAFVDISLPGMSGYEVAERLRATMRPGAMLVALSGHDSEEHRTRAEEVGFDQYLVKPVTDEQLMATLARCRQSGVAAAR